MLTHFETLAPIIGWLVMLTQILPGLVMFAITVGFVTLMFVPATVFKQKNELINFYWAGIWVFLALIAAFSGGSETLVLFQYESRYIAENILAVIMLCFIIFVTFGWFRLSFKAISAGIKHAIAIRK